MLPFPLIITGEEAWKMICNEIKQEHGIDPGRMRVSPESYPCLVFCKRLPKAMDITFVYENDARALLNACEQTRASAPPAAPAPEPKELESLRAIVDAHDNHNRALSAMVMCLCEILISKQLATDESIMQGQTKFLRRVDECYTREADAHLTSESVKGVNDIFRRLGF